MGHISQDSCTSVSFDQFSSLDAPEGMGAACKTECTPTTIMHASCCRKLRAKPRNQVGQITFSLKVTEVSRQCRTATFQAHNMLLDVCIAAEDCRSRILTYPAFARVE